MAIIKTFWWITLITIQITNQISWNWSMNQQINWQTGWEIISQPVKQFTALNKGDQSIQNNQQKTAEEFKTIKALHFIPLHSIGSKIKGIILPHHLLVGSFIDKFYRQLQEKNSYDTIILISPNHFGYGFNYLQTTDQTKLGDTTINLDLNTIKKLDKQRVASIEPKYYSREHGITAHINYLNQYFPKAKIIPIIIKNQTPEAQLDRLIEKIHQLKTSKTLILASIDFTHYTDEEFALQNDQKMVNWLENLQTDQVKPVEFYEQTLDLGKSFDISNKDSVAIDSPESLYVMASLMKDIKATQFSLWTRTSTASLTAITKPEQNTSHIFGSFQ